MNTTTFWVVLILESQENSWNLEFTFCRPGKSCNWAQVMENNVDSHGKSWKTNSGDDRF